MLKPDGIDICHDNPKVKFDMALTELISTLKKTHQSFTIARFL